MDILYLLVPLSVILVLMIIGVFAWAVQAGQFDELEHEGARILVEPPVDPAPERVPPPAGVEAETKSSSPLIRH